MDALRFLVVLHQLGRPSAHDGLARELVGEQLVVQLDHLVRHPITVAYWTLDDFARQDAPAEGRSVVARRVRQLLAIDRQRRQPVRRRRPWQSTADALEEGRKRHPLLIGRWQCLDDVVAFAASRDLVRVGVADPSALLTYGLTQRAVHWLEKSVYPTDRDVALLVQTCTLLNELVPALLERAAEGDLPGADPGERLVRRLEQVGRRLLPY